MKLSKLRRIIREEYSKISRENHLINEADIELEDMLYANNIGSFIVHMRNKDAREKEAQREKRFSPDGKVRRYRNWSRPLSPEEEKRRSEELERRIKQQAEIEAANKRLAIINSDSRKKLIRDSRAGHLLVLVNSAFPYLNIFKYPGDSRVFKQPQFAGQSGDPREAWLETTCNEILGLLHTGFEVSSEASKKLKLLGDNQGVDFSIDELITQQGSDTYDIFVESLPGGTYRISVSQRSLQPLYVEIKTLLNDIINSREGKKYELNRGLSNYLRECANRIRRSRYRLQVL